MQKQKKQRRSLVLLWIACDEKEKADGTVLGYIRMVVSTHMASLWRSGGTRTAVQGLRSLCPADHREEA
jgi:hypothetical protein